MPVSYTHLDVYKRQAQQHSCTFSAEKYNYAEIVAASINVHSANKQQPMLIAAHARSEDMIPVSYTHLDVYKRQI